MLNSNLYNPDAVRQLFDEMAGTYGFMNLVTSFGFAARWRRQAIANLPETAPFIHAADLMSGMGELWRSLARRYGGELKVVAVDISPKMTRYAMRSPPLDVTMRIEDIFTSDFPPGSFDAVVSSFGLKTLSADQQAELARMITRWLRPGGVFSFVEISVPASPLLQIPYMFYLKRIIPVLGRLFLGNPDNYRMLGAYTEAFGNCDHFANCIRQAGMQTRFVRYFFGCATGVFGVKSSS